MCNLLIGMLLMVSPAEFDYLVDGCGEYMTLTYEIYETEEIEV